MLALSKALVRGLFLGASCAVLAMALGGCGRGITYGTTSPTSPTPPIIATLSTANITFGNTIVGAISPSQSLTLTVNSTTALTITSITASGPFSQNNNCPASLSPSAFCTINVTFNPIAMGTATGSINFIDNASNSPQTVGLSGVGLAPPTTLSPSSLTFGDTGVGTTSSTQPLSLKNNLTTSVGINISVNGLFSQTNNCSASLNASASCTIIMTFAPTTTGMSTGTVTVVDNISNRPVTTSLSGNGTAGFVSTGSLVTGRYQHTATVLNTGKVLITGGESALPVLLTPLASAELYDPDAGTFTPTGSMEASRRHHTATLLNNGKVLIVGGQFSAQASEELYDPAIGAFTSTGRMTTFRLLHTATLLNNGKVLITGGNGKTDGTGPPLASSELYDPATGMFTVTGNMTSARENHTATLMNSGKVLIIGGDKDSVGIPGAELYDPATGLFSLTGGPSTLRSLHTATLVNNGKVLIAAGSNPGISVSSNAELYDASNGTSTLTGSLNNACEFHTATLLTNGMVFITGGLGNVGGVVSEIYDPATGAFSTGPSIATAEHTATLLNKGGALDAGGDDGANVLAAAYLYPPDSLSPPGLISIVLTPATPMMLAGSTQQFIATGTFSDGSHQLLQSVTWSSSNTTVATITNDASNHGAALAVAAGTTTIQASAGSISGVIVLTVH